MPEGWTTLSDYFNPLDAAIKIQQLDELKTRNRLQYMQAQEVLKNNQETQAFLAKQALQPSMPKAPAAPQVAPGAPAAAGQLMPPQAQTPQPQAAAKMAPTAPGMAPSGMPGAAPAGAPGGVTPTAAPKPTVDQQPPEVQQVYRAMRTLKTLAPKDTEAFKALRDDPSDEEAFTVLRANADVRKSSDDIQAYLNRVGLDFTRNVDKDKEGKVAVTDTYSRNWTRKELDTLADLTGRESFRNHPEGRATLTMDPVHSTISGFVAEKQDEKYTPEVRLLEDKLTEENGGKKPTKQQLYSEWRKLELQKKTEGSNNQGAGRYKFMMRDYLDTKNGNQIITLSNEEVANANKQEPGRYVSAAPGTKALAKTATVEDISDANQATKEALKNLKTDFTPGLRMKLAQVFKDRDPNSAFDNFMGSTFAQTLTPDQQDYVVAINQNLENAMAMRSVLGAGQGSHDLRAAIQRTIPGMLTPNKAMAFKQIDAFNNQLMRLARGIPKIKLRGQEEVKGNLKEQASGKKTIPADLPPAAANKGKRAKDPDTGESYISDGVNWSAE